MSKDQHSTAEKTPLRRISRGALQLFVGSWTLFSPKKLLDLDDADPRLTKGARLKSAVDAIKVAYTLPDPTQVRHEDFATAVERLKLSQGNIETRRKQLLIESRIGYSMACVLILLAVVYADTGTRPSAFAAVSLAAACSIFGWLKAFRAWQLEIRRFAPLREFSRKPDCWVA